MERLEDEEEEKGEAEEAEEKGQPLKREKGGSEEGLTDDELDVMERALCDLRAVVEQRLRRQSDAQLLKQSAAHDALAGERDALQRQQADMQLRVVELEQRLEGAKMRASQAAAESAEWKRSYEEGAAENNNYSKQLLDMLVRHHRLP